MIGFLRSAGKDREQVFRERVTHKKSAANESIRVSPSNSLHLGVIAATRLQVWERVWHEWDSTIGKLTGKGDAYPVMSRRDIRRWTMESDEASCLTDHVVSFLNT